ncbi:MAG: hypothetical protein J7639_07960 [Paenibacillaceae bacterium]|nr:hypothetical protein [Paenibacillaceae bacterium]
MTTRHYNGTYREERNARIAYPLGGIGSGSLCLEGTGALSHVSLRNAPDLVHEPTMFAAVSVRQNGGVVAKVLESAVPVWKVFDWPNDGKGWGAKHFGLPRFAESSFAAKFPFGVVELTDASMPIRATVTGWSPFTPPHADDSSLPVAALEYTLHNDSDEPLELVYSFHASHFMNTGRGTHQVLPVPGGFALYQPPAEGAPWERGAFAASIADDGVKVHHTWFRGGYYDARSMLWKAIAEGAAPESAPVTEGMPSPGASLFLPLRLEAKQSRTIRLQLAWHVPDSNLRLDYPWEADQAKFDDETSRASGDEYYQPWYAGKYRDIFQVASDWRERYDSLRAATETFARCFFDSTLPDEVLEAAAANLTILKSPTVMRQTDGRLWGWEGVALKEGSCFGSCTHVWNYAHAFAHLFPGLERSLRQSEFNEGQDELGFQTYRIPLPIRPIVGRYTHSAADGQLGGIMKMYREWRIGGDTDWLRAMWPKVERSLGYCIETWDPDRTGMIVEPHHNTYDIEFWGPDGMCCSMYVGALKAASLMAHALGEPAQPYETLYEKGRAYLENELFNGDYFEQRVVWEGLQSPSPLDVEVKAVWEVAYSPEARELFHAEGPKYQYATGCLSDGIIGAWMARMCGLGDIVDPAKVRSHLLSVYRHNFRRDLSDHANPQRSGYALGREGGLLICTWPRGGKPSLPFVYSDEVWTGIEYQVASHLMAIGCAEEGLDIVRTCRDRFDGRLRNPFDEYECGHWYARAMASYALLQGLTGIRYDALTRTLTIEPGLSGDFRSFICTASGYGTAGVRGGEPFFEPASGEIKIEQIDYKAFGGAESRN